MADLVSTAFAASITALIIIGPAIGLYGLVIAALLYGFRQRDKDDANVEKMIAAEDDATVEPMPGFPVRGGGAIVGTTADPASDTERLLILDAYQRRRSDA